MITAIALDVPLVGSELHTGELRSDVGVELSSGGWRMVLANQESEILLEVSLGAFVSDEAKGPALWAPQDHLEEVDSHSVKCQKFLSLV